MDDDIRIMKNDVKEHIRKIAYAAFSTINILLPKRKRVCVYGGEFLQDNSEAMLRYLAEDGSFDVICVVDKRIEKEELYKGVIFKKNTHFNAFLSCATSKIVLDSSLHTIKMRPSRGQAIIQMWHGSPLKHLPKDEFIDNGKYYSFVFYASDLFKHEMKSCFSIEENKLFLSGCPRNDYLFEKTNLPAAFGVNRKAVMWLPTFRHGIGLNESSKDIPIITDNNIHEIATLLKSKDIKLFVKPHPLQVTSIDNILKNVDDRFIQLIKDEDLRFNGMTLYEMLGCMDALITDYSSVYFDFLLLNRPIGFAIDDIEEYERARGFALKNPTEYMPGVQIKSINELKKFLDDVDKGIDFYSDDREKVNTLANYYQGNDNRKRCMELIKKIL